MRKIIVIIVSVLFASCMVKTYPLTGTYPASPMIFATASPIDSVWNKIIDIFAQRGISIKIIDKSSGLIISERGLITYTIENKNGMPIDNSAMIVVPKQYNPNTKKFGATYANPTAEFNIHLKQQGNQTTVNINITNVKYSAYNLSYKAMQDVNLYTYKSTGFFENSIYEQIK